MCIAIVATAGKVVSDAILDRCSQSNPDGGGFAYIDKSHGNVVVRKGYFNVEDFKKSYKEVLEKGHGEDNAMLLHFRIATLGKIEYSNCHPFNFKNGAAIHNGSFWYSTNGNSRDAAKSDTRELVERLATKFDYDSLTSAKQELNAVIGHNKMAFLFKTGQYVILNEKEGVWDEDIWYSHRGYRPYGTYTSRDIEAEDYYSRHYGACGWDIGD